MATISPDPADKMRHLELLLGLADDVNHVQTTMDGPTGLAFVVPEYLAAQYEEALALMAGEDSEEQSDAPDETPVKRKPGRPKKNTDSA